MVNKDKIAVKFKEQVKPFLDGFTDKLLAAFEKENIILRIDSKSPEVYYQLNFNQSILQSLKTIAPRDIFKDLFEFRNIVNIVYRFLKYTDSDLGSSYTFTQTISKLQEHGAISAPWINNENIVSVFDKLDSLVGDDIEIRKEIEKIITDNNININALTLQIFEFYGKQKAKSYFSELGYKEYMESSASDLILIPFKLLNPILVFEFKYRRKSPMPSRDLIIKSLRQIEEISDKFSGVPNYFLIIFTQHDFNNFERIRLQYKKELREITKYEEYKKRLVFMPIAVNFLNLIDEEFKDYKHKSIQQNIQFKFTNQNPPIDNPSRNDHFLDRIFEFKKNDFEITVIPINTNFWRFGLKFSKNEKFPALNEQRHLDNNFADIVITVGDLITKSLTWTNPNKLGMTVYHADIIKDEFTNIEDYTGYPMLLSIISNDDGSQLEVSIKTNEKTIGKKTINLMKFNYCKIYSWCDYGQFQLDSDIKVIHK